jgi:crotonobetainyl-CoA:carnitine CoA-transferase CaiB-like acyl-CoA transferase
VSTIFGPHFPTTIDLMKADNAAGFLAEERWRSATRFSPLPGQWQCTQEEADAAENVFADWIARYTRAEIMEMARKHELMLFPVNTIADNIDSPQLAARDFYQTVEHEDIGVNVTYPGAPIVLSRTPWRMKSRAPRLGEHNAEVYGAINIGSGELDRLRGAGVV